MRVLACIKCADLVRFREFLEPYGGSVEVDFTWEAAGRDYVYVAYHVTTDDEEVDALYEKLKAARNG